MKKMIFCAAALGGLSLFACSDDSDGENVDGSGGSDVGGDGGTMGDGGTDGDGGTGGTSDPGNNLLGPDGKPELGAQIDRTGRPAISTALIETFNGDEGEKGDEKDAYNAATPSTSESFAATMKTSLAILDSLDGTCGAGTQLLVGDGDDRYGPLTGVLLDDQLYVNSTQGTCGVYLGAEGEFVGALAEGEGACGGRTPLDDVIERSYSVLAAGALTGIDDTITSDGAPHDPNVFPFLAAPN